MAVAAYLIGLGVGFVGSIPIAGPIALLVLQRGIARRFQSGLMLAYGAAVAETAYATVACLGLGALLARYPGVGDLAHGFSGLALALVGLFFFLQRPRAEAVDDEKLRFERRGSFVLGLTITAFNPTLIATWTGTLSLLFVAFGLAIPPTGAPLLGLGAGSGIAAWFTLATWLMRRYGDRVNRDRLQGVVRAIGLLLVAVGLAQLWIASSHAMQ